MVAVDVVALVALVLDTVVGTPSLAHPLVVELVLVLVDIPDHTVELKLRVDRDTLKFTPCMLLPLIGYQYLNI